MKASIEVSCYQILQQDVIYEDDSAKEWSGKEQGSRRIEVRLEAPVEDVQPPPFDPDIER